MVGLVVDLSPDAQQVLKAALADQGFFGPAEPLLQRAVYARNSPIRIGVQDATGQIVDVRAAGFD